MTDIQTIKAFIDEYDGKGKDKVPDKLPALRNAYGLYDILTKDLKYNDELINTFISKIGSINIKPSQNLSAQLREILQIREALAQAHSKTAKINIIKSYNLNNLRSLAKDALIKLYSVVNQGISASSDSGGVQTEQLGNSNPSPILSPPVRSDPSNQLPNFGLPSGLAQFREFNQVVASPSVILSSSPVILSSPPLRPSSPLVPLSSPVRSSSPLVRLSSPPLESTSPLLVVEEEKEEVVQPASARQPLQPAPARQPAPAIDEEEKQAPLDSTSLYDKQNDVDVKVTCYVGSELVGTFSIPTNREHPINKLKRLIQQNVGLSVNNIRLSMWNEDFLENNELVGNEIVFSAYGTLLPEISTALDKLQSYNVRLSNDTIEIGNISWQTLRVVNERLKTIEGAIIDLRMTSEMILNDVLVVLKERESVKGVLFNDINIKKNEDILLNELIASRPFNRIGFTNTVFPTDKIFDTLRHATIYKLIWKNSFKLGNEDKNKQDANESIVQIMLVNHSIKHANLDIDAPSKKMINRVRHVEFEEKIEEEKYDSLLTIGGTVFTNCPTIFYLKPNDDFPIVLLFKEEIVPQDAPLDNSTIFERIYRLVDLDSLLEKSLKQCIMAELVKFDSKFAWYYNLIINMPVHDQYRDLTEFNDAMAFFDSLSLHNESDINSDCNPSRILKLLERLLKIGEKLYNDHENDIKTANIKLREIYDRKMVEYEKNKIEYEKTKDENLPLKERNKIKIRLTPLLAEKPLLTLLDIRIVEEDYFKARNNIINAMSHINRLFDRGKVSKDIINLWESIDEEAILNMAEDKQKLDFIRMYDEIKKRQGITERNNGPICVGKALPYLEITGTGQVPQSLFITFDETDNKEHLALAEMVRKHPTIRWLPLPLFRNERLRETDFVLLMRNVIQGLNPDNHILVTLVRHNKNDYEWMPYQFAETLFNFLKPNSILFERIGQQNGANYIVRDVIFWQKMYGRLLYNFLSDHPFEPKGYFRRFMLNRPPYTHEYDSLFEAIIRILSVVCLIADILPRKKTHIAALVSGYLPDYFINLVIDGLVYTQSYKLTQMDDLSVDLESHIKKIQVNRPPPIPEPLKSRCIIA